MLIHGDCLEAMKDIPDSSVDMVLTSPPYDDRIKYNNSLVWDINIFKKIALQIHRVIKRGGVCVWIVADKTKECDESGTSFRHALYFKDIGFNLSDTMIYLKKNPMPSDNRYRYQQSFEYMFVFTKGKPKTFNPLKEKCLNYRKKSNKRYRNGERIFSSKGTHIIKKMKVSSNVWELCVCNERGINHPAMFSLELAEKHIFSWSNQGDAVLDCFMGSGTTGVACKNLNRNFIGIEKEEKYFKIAKQRIEDCPLKLITDI